MRIALVGTRGIPAHYGGFETFYEHLGPGLAARGHDVTVYIRPHAVGDAKGRRYRGVRLVPLPSVRTKHLETITHTFVSMAHVLTCEYDVVYVCGVGNTPLAWIPRLRRTPVVLNVDGADWRRSKWGPVAARYLRVVERMAPIAAGAVVTDSRAVQARYRAEYRFEPTYFPYGADLVERAGISALDEFGLTRRGYFLWVGRLEPEAGTEDALRAFARLGPVGQKLVIVGDAPYADRHIQQLRALATREVVLAGYQFGAAYRQLGYHATAYIHTSAISGTSPALLDQMASGGLVIARRTPANLEVIGNAGLTYKPSPDGADLAHVLSEILANPVNADALRVEARRRVATEYSWDRIVLRYEALFEDLIGESRVTK